MNPRPTEKLFCTALRETLSTRYSLGMLRSDVIAGLTVGLVAVPLAMALAIASGVPPQYGLYTSIVAGLIIAIAGGSRFNVSGPTAAFVVLLLPIVEKYGFGGLLLTTVLSGLMLVIMGIARLGRLIQFIPYPVTLGFTAGIAVVIAVLQLKDLFGMTGNVSGEHFSEKVVALLTAMPTAHMADLSIGLLTLAVLITWPRLKTLIPPHLVALLVGSLAAAGAAWVVPDFSVATIGSRFGYELNGDVGSGIPPVAPHWVLPWTLPDANGQPVGLSFGLIRELLPSAFAVALLGAVESLLCAVVADGLTGSKHNPNGELIGQGLGNIAAPFFGGITATAAIARTATNIRAGAQSPVAAMIHAITVLLAVVVFAPWLAYVPMASLAALLMVVAWNMSEARHFANVVRVAPRSDVVVLLVCFGLTVLFDMVLAVSVGVVLASVLFIKRMTEISDVRLVQREERPHADLPREIAIYDLNGPLFFGAAEKAISVLSRVTAHVKVVILDMADVPLLDMTGIVALDSIIKKLNRQGVALVLANLSPRLYRKLLQAGFRRETGKLACTTSMAEAVAEASVMLRPPASSSTNTSAPT